jgi:hypothetical protein
LNTTVGTSNIDIADVETLNLNVQETASVNFDGLSMTTASTYSTLNVTGDSALTITALHADVTTIDSSASTGSVVMSARSATTASTYTGGEGADTFIMKHASDAISSGTGADTLDIDLAAILGGIQVDLSSATDQVTTMNGGSNTAVQLGFENVDVSGYTGFGAVITAAATGSSITGTTSADSITLGTAAVTDTVTLQNTTADTITNFTFGASGDNISITVTGIDAENGDGGAISGSLVVNSQATADDTDIAATDEILVFTDSIADAATMENALDDLQFATSSFADDDDFLVLWHDGTNAHLSSVNLAVTDDAGDKTIDDTGNTVTEIATLAGVTDLSGVNTANFTAV